MAKDRQPSVESGGKGRIEGLIRERLAGAVADGLGQWMDSPSSPLGRPIFRLAQEVVTLVLAESGLLYDGPALPFACRYAEIEHIALSDFDAPTPSPDEFSCIEISLREIPERLQLKLPRHICPDVATMLDLIVQDLG